MGIKVNIPTPLRAYTGQQAVVEVEGTNIGELLKNLTAAHGDLKPHLYSQDGKLRSFVNVYLNDEDIRYLDEMQTVVKDGQLVALIPAVAGG